MSIHLARKILKAFVAICWNQPSFYFLFRLFSYKVLVEFNMFGKVKEDGKTKAAFEKKRICDAIVVTFIFFASRLLRSVEALVLIKLRYTLQHCLMDFKFDDY